MSETEDRGADPADEPNESAWNDEVVEGQLDELDELDEDSLGEEEAAEDEAGEGSAEGI